MSVDYTAIANAVLPGEDCQTAFDRLSALTIDVDKNIDTKLIKQYLILVDKWLPIKNSAEPAALITVEALDTFETFDITNAAAGAMIKSKLDSMMDALIADGLIGPDDKTAILSLGKNTELKWPNLKFGHIADALRYRAGGNI